MRVKRTACCQKVRYRLGSQHLPAAKYAFGVPLAVAVTVGAVHRATYRFERYKLSPQLQSNDLTVRHFSLVISLNLQSLTGSGSANC